jgi:peptidoglycan hydrolase-like protein with peptidoglycan-binding domain
VNGLQQGLEKLGFPVAATSGTFNSSTESAVKAFERATGQRTDGVVDAKAVEALIASLKRQPQLELLPLSALKASASSRLSPAKSNTYVAANALDGNPKTSWNEGAKGPGQWISFKFGATTRVGRIDVIGGCAKSDAVYHANSRIRKLTVITDSGEFKFALLDTMAFQPLLEDFGATKKVRLRIDSAYPGTKYPAPP